MRLFLSGGGRGKDSIELDRKFASAVGRDNHLLYVPIAINTQKHPYPECFKWINGTFNQLGINIIEMWTEKELWEKTEENLEGFGGIYIGGGNTFYLLKELKDSGFFLKLKRLVKNNVPVYGGSAGAVIFGKTIIPALSADPNDVGLTNFDAMNLIRDYDLWPHYQPDINEAIKQYKQKYGLKIIALPENSGLCITDETIEVVGPGSAYPIDDNINEVIPGRNIK